MESLRTRERQTFPLSDAQADFDKIFRFKCWQNAAIPERHAKAHLAKLLEHPQWSERWAKATKAMDRGSIIGMLGTRGNGKTQMAVELIRRNCQRIKTPKYVDSLSASYTAGRYVRGIEIGVALREAYRKDAEVTEDQVLRLFTRSPLLVVDELQEMPDSVKQWLTLMLDRRYADVLPTVLIANCDKDQFVTLVGNSIADRAKEGGGLLMFDWPSFRGGN